MGEQTLPNAQPPASMDGPGGVEGAFSSTAWAAVRLSDGFISANSVRVTEGAARQAFAGGWPEGWRHAYRKGWRILPVTISATRPALANRPQEGGGGPTTPCRSHAARAKREGSHG